MMANARGKPRFRKSLADLTPPPRPKPPESLTPREQERHLRSPHVARVSREADPIGMGDTVCCAVKDEDGLIALFMRSVMNETRHACGAVVMWYSSAHRTPAHPGERR